MSTIRLVFHTLEPLPLLAEKGWLEIAVMVPLPYGDLQGGRIFLNLEVFHPAGEPMDRDQLSSIRGS